MSEMTTFSTMKEIAAPLGSIETGHLVFTRGASHLLIGADPSMNDLFRAHFDRKVPEVGVDGGTVSVKYRPSFHPPTGEITLRAGSPGRSGPIGGCPKSWRTSRVWSSGTSTSREAALDLRSGYLVRTPPSRFGSAAVPATWR